jgi:hypothetical protein
LTFSPESAENQDPARWLLVAERKQRREQPIVIGLRMKTVLGEECIRRLRVESQRMHAKSHADRRRRQAKGQDSLEDRIGARLLAARPRPLETIELGENDRGEDEIDAGDT